MDASIKIVLSDESNARSAAYRAMRDSLPGATVEGDAQNKIGAAHKIAATVARKAVADVFKALKARVKREDWQPVHIAKARIAMRDAGVAAYRTAMQNLGFGVTDAALAVAVKANDARIAERETLRKIGAGGVPAATLDSVFAT